MDAIVGKVEGREKESKTERREGAIDREKGEREGAIDREERREAEIAKTEYSLIKIK